MGLFCDNRQTNATNLKVEAQQHESALMWTKYFEDIFDSDSDDVELALRKAGFKLVMRFKGFRQYSKGHVLVVCSGGLEQYGEAYPPKAFYVKEAKR